MKQKTPNERTVAAEFKAVMEKLSPDQQKSVKDLLATVDAIDWTINRRKLIFSCRDYLRVAAEINNDALQAKFEAEDLSPNERLMFLPATEEAILDELENLKTEALLQDDDLALEYSGWEISDGVNDGADGTITLTFSNESWTMEWCHNAHCMYSHTHEESL